MMNRRAWYEMSSEHFFGDQDVLEDISAVRFGARMLWCVNEHIPRFMTRLATFPVLIVAGGFRTT